jgi:hypothetical protein
MTPQLLPFTATPKLSKVEALAAYFKARPGQWLSALDLAKVGGALAWRTRLSDLRRPPYAMQIENRQEPHREYGRISFYRFVA